MKSLDRIQVEADLAQVLLDLFNEGARENALAHPAYFEEYFNSPKREEIRRAALRHLAQLRKQLRDRAIFRIEARVHFHPKP